MVHEVMVTVAEILINRPPPSWRRTQGKYRERNQEESCGGEVEEGKMKRSVFVLG